MPPYHVNWICGINSRKVKPEVQAPLLAFQKKLQVIIHEALSGRISVEMFQALQQQMAAMAEQIRYLTTRLAEVEQGVVPYVNQGISSAARALRQGHMKYTH